MNVGRKVAIAVGLVAVFVAGGLVYAFWPRDTTEITHDDAVADFRANDTRADSSSAAAEDRSTPKPGVYTFSASGQEEVKLGPLPAETRPLPATVTAVAVPSGDGCFDWTVNLFAEHTEDTRWCTGDGLRLGSHVKHQKIGPVSPTATMQCDPNLVRPKDADDDTATGLTCTLGLSGGPASITATLTGTATTGATDVLSVGDERVSTVPVAIHYTVDGDLSGSWDETTWWSEAHLPVKVERSLQLTGLANFTETSSLVLTSLEPSS